MCKNNKKIIEKKWWEAGINIAKWLEETEQNLEAFPSTCRNLLYDNSGTSTKQCEKATQYI